MPTKETAEKTIRLTQVKSVIGATASQRATVRALGLKRINDTVEQKDSPAIRGMVFRVHHLVKVEEL